MTNILPVQDIEPVKLSSRFRVLQQQLTTTTVKTDHLVSCATSVNWTSTNDKAWTQDLWQDIHKVPPHPYQLTLSPKAYSRSPIQMWNREVWCRPNLCHPPVMPDRTPRSRKSHEGRTKRLQPATGCQHCAL
jgi:hypothetical protein